MAEINSDRGQEGEKDTESETKDPWESDRQLNLLRSGICSLCNVPNQFLRCDSLGRWVCPDCHTEQD